MKRISGYSFSIAVAVLLFPAVVAGQDTISFPLRFGVGTALHLPLSRLAGVYPQGAEINGFYDINERIALAADGGFSRFLHEEYNYRYENNGFYFRAGIDYNLLNPVQAAGRYFAGLSLRYGISFYNHLLPEINYRNYWGDYSTAAPGESNTGHFLEVSPGIRAEIFSNVFIGWSVNMRFLLWSSAGSDLRAVDIPGFGNGSKVVSRGINYFISFRIPYRTKQVIYIKPERDTEEPENVNLQGGR
jgi:hypothetical protein